jgi:hypothetical protein
VPDETKYKLEPIIRESVEGGTTISTDGHYAYRDLSGNYAHNYLDPSAKEYVRRDYRTNSIGGHRSLLKRAIRGTHVSNFQQAAWNYITEFSYRLTYGDVQLSYARFVGRSESACGDG